MYSKNFKYYVNTINEYLQEFLDRNEFDCDVELGTDFAYWYSKSLITYTLAITDKQGESFVAFAESLFPDIKADVFLWSFLHELGHHETLDDFDGVAHFVYHQIVNSDIPMSANYYYNLPIEKAATEWAGEFMRNNTDEVYRLWQKVQPVIKKIYFTI